MLQLDGVDRLLHWPHGDGFEIVAKNLAPSEFGQLYQ